MDLSIVKTVTTICGMIAAVGGVAALIYKLVRWIAHQGEQDAEIKALREMHIADMDALREELTVICYASLACLDGLKQLGANGNVTKAHDKLDKHLNQKAHK